MTIEAKYDLKLSVEEVLALGVDLAGDPTATHQITGTSGTLTGSTTVPATTVWGDKRQLAAGTDTIDLTALVEGNLPNKDLTGLKLQLIKLKATSTNTAVLTVKPAATNGYEFGATNDEITLHPGGAVLLFVPDLAPDVAAGAKDITVTSSDADAEYEILIVAG